MIEEKVMKQNQKLRQQEQKLIWLKQRQIQLTDEHRKSSRAGGPRLCDVVNNPMNKWNRCKSTCRVVQFHWRHSKEAYECFCQIPVQGAVQGYHPPNRAYAPQNVQPNYSFPPSDMGPDFFYSPPAEASSLSSGTSEQISFDENDFFLTYRNSCCRCIFHIKNDHLKQHIIP